MSNYTHFPETGLVRLSTILKVIPVGKTTWWNGVKSGRFPKPSKMGPRITVWRSEDIRALIDQSNQTMVSSDALNSKGGNHGR